MEGYFTTDKAASVYQAKWDHNKEKKNKFLQPC